jgi:hypothetical protein
MLLVPHHLEVLQGGLRCRDRKTKRFCARLLGVYPADGRASLLAHVQCNISYP